MAPKTVLMFGFVMGYARKTMNNMDIAHHPSRAFIEHRIKALKYFGWYEAEATK